MNRFLKGIIINALLFLGLSFAFPHGFFVGSIWVALGASFVLTMLNFLVKPILFILSLPITILTLGLFSFVINGFMLQLTAFLVGPNFQISSLWMAMLIAILMSIGNGILNSEDSKS